ncbi:TBC1 domain family member 19 isoform X2 [Syngnathus acus]|uniref:TBC1 domain family member 19 isoform X2 n=1 Tax=Syngnathus acus TaxID=161584 RepID=UPI001885F303|nr:TBC1 domain family member 19 isoform X2 [Syngnathus acus]
MDEGAELSLTIVQLVQRLKGSHLHAQMEREARECLHQPEIRLDSIKDDVRSFLRTSGWEKKLQNAVYRELQVERLASSLTAAAPPEHVKEPLAYMRKAQAGWERRILKSLNGMSTELGVPLARMRTAAEQRELSSKWNEMGTDEADLTGFRPIYAAKDFLEVVVALRSPNHKCGGDEEPGTRSHWGLIQVPLDVQDIQQLRGAYAELNLAAGQLGIDDDGHIHPDFFERDYVETAKKVLGGQDSAAAQQYSRRGCPTGLRADLWALILNSVDRPQDAMHFEQLKAGVVQHDLLVDHLIRKDVKLTASNDDYYFVFEDFLYQVLLCFSRDASVLEHFKYNSATPPKSYIRGKEGDEAYAVVYPPNGVIPFHGFSMYAAHPRLFQWPRCASCTRSRQSCTACSGRCTPATFSAYTLCPRRARVSCRCVCFWSGSCRRTCRDSSTTCDGSELSRYASPLSGCFELSQDISAPTSCFSFGTESWATTPWSWWRSWLPPSSPFGPRT